MKRKYVRGAAATLVTLVLFSTASNGAAQVTAEDAACRASIQKAMGKLGATSNKTIDGCIKAVLGEKATITTDCNDVFLADFKGKMPDAVTKAKAGVTGKCDMTDNPSLLTTAYPSCPSPAQALDDGGVAGVDSFGELANCEAEINTTGVETARRYILNPDAPAVVAQLNKKVIAKCANAIAKNATKLWSAVSKERGKCQAAADKGGGSYAYTCSTGSSEKIDAARAKLDEAIDKACTGLSAGELGLIGTCDNDLTGIKTCVKNAIEKNASGATATAFEFAGVCPTEVKIVVNAGTEEGNTLHLNNTVLDTGWNGLGHRHDVIDGFVGRVNLACSGPDCESCSVTVNCEEGNCRCSNDTFVQCNVPFTQDVCGAGNTCIVHFGPPLAVSAGGTPVCVVNTIQTELAGTADAGTGSSTTNVSNTAKVFLGISQTQPCPICTGATIGMNGTCIGGSRDTLACTTNAVHPTFGGSSYQCPPTPGLNTTGAGLQISLSLTDGNSTLAFGDACDAPVATFDCACGVCTLDASKTCRVDADCTGFGTCGNAGAGVARKPNGCSGLVCDDLGNERGQCNGGPDDLFCDGITKADGDGFIPCTTNVDCTPFLAGDCAITHRRPCFLDPIEADGVPGQDGAELVSTFCTPPTVSASVNASTGLPGPGRLALDFDFTAFCPDGSTKWELGGSNCP